MPFPVSYTVIKNTLYLFESKLIISILDLLFAIYCLTFLQNIWIYLKLSVIYTHISPNWVNFKELETKLNRICLSRIGSF